MTVYARGDTMNLFDKACASLAFVLGLAFLVLGVIGLFAGCSAQFTLPPILGMLPALVGWGIVRAVWFGWSAPPRISREADDLLEKPDVPQL
jgi:hypothetical protein